VHRFEQARGLRQVDAIRQRPDVSSILKSEWIQDFKLAQPEVAPVQVHWDIPDQRWPTMDYYLSAEI